MTLSHCRSRFSLAVFFVFLASQLVPAWEGKSTQNQDAIQNQDPLNRPLNSGRQAKAARERESRHYRDWLEDVRVIITNEELAAFKKLGTDAERDNFIEMFWKHRDPTPDTEENEYKDEFYRRKAYANEHFSSGVRGERTDRGRIYILWGPPDSIESHPMGGPYLRSAEEGGGTTTTYPFEVWRYRHLEGAGPEVTIEFVDQCGCGEYRRTLNHSDKDAMKNIPNAGPTEAEAMLGVSKADRLRDPEGVGQTLFGQNNGTKFFERLEQEVALDRPPAPHGMGTDVSHIIRYKLLPFDVRVDFVRAPLDTVLVPVTVQVPTRELTYISKEGLQRRVVNIFGRVTTLSGNVAQTFEDTLRLDVPSDSKDTVANNSALYWKALPMRPGLYLLDIVVKDVNGGKTGSVTTSIRVPDYRGEHLVSSSLILADIVEPVSPREVGGGNFMIGPTRVRPRVAAQRNPVSFRGGQQVSLWMQVYNLSLDQKTGKPTATVEYRVVNTATNQAVIDLTESSDKMGNAGDQLTLQKRLPAMPVGNYQLTVRVNDLLSGQIISSMAPFVITKD
ncbi:MAG TPA: GWxTD domain-containing protein [Candidatus Angelobacter sp.]